LARHADHCSRPAGSAGWTSHREGNHRRKFAEGSTAINFAIAYPVNRLVIECLEDLRDAIIKRADIGVSRLSHSSRATAAPRYEVRSMSCHKIRRTGAVLVESFYE
jgi:hypothetical protein